MSKRQNLYFGFILTIFPFILFTYLTETTFTLWLFFKSRPSSKQTKPTPPDTRTKIEVITETEAKGIDIRPSIHPMFFIDSDGIEWEGKRIYPLGSFSRRRNLWCYCLTEGRWRDFESDRYGFNNPVGTWEKENIEIVLIGDSFAQGQCVEGERDIAGYLRARGRSVLNLGSSGNGPLSELATLKEYAEPIKPKVVLWVYFEGNDLSDLVREKKSPTLLRYLDVHFSQRLFDRQPEIDVALERFYQQQKLTELRNENQKTNTRAKELIEPFVLWMKLTQVRKNLGLIHFTMDPLLKQVLKTAKETTSSWNGRFYFVYLPDFDRYSRLIVNQEIYFNRGKVMAIAKELKIPLIDFCQRMDREIAFSGVEKKHYSPEGYRLVAELVKDSI